MIKKPLATMPTLNSRRIRLVLTLGLLLLCLIKTIHLKLTSPLNQAYLEYQALQLQQLSNFNPKNNLIELFDYLNTWHLNNTLKDHQHSNPKYQVDKVSTIGDSHGVYFHWDDWVDLSLGNKKLDKVRQRNSKGQDHLDDDEDEDQLEVDDNECDASLLHYANVNAHRLESLETKHIRGRCQLYCLFPIPQRIIATTDNLFIEIPVIGKKRLGIQVSTTNNDKKFTTTTKLVSTMENLQNNFRQHYHNHNQQNLHTSEEPQLLIRNITRLQPKIDNLSVKDFVFNIDSEIEKLQIANLTTENGLNQTDLSRLNFYQQANALVDKTDRHFKYAWVFTDIIQGYTHHIAYPFFNRYISDRERQSVLHHMIRVWFQLMETYGYTSWINYGNLLGWKFNGLNMPWDTDIDVQMPIVELDRLAMNLNQTLIIENPRFGNARYWLEISPSYIRQGNGKNHIDARFIDIHSGLYIDITGLSTEEMIPEPATTTATTTKGEVNQSNEDENDVAASSSSIAVHCKNWNWHKLNELLPLKQAFFEGSSVYIPNNVSTILLNKYGDDALSDYKFHNHIYYPDISMWINNDICQLERNTGVIGGINLGVNIKNWNPTTNTNNNNNEGEEKSPIESLCDLKYIQDEYNIIKESVMRHQYLENLNLEDKQHQHEQQQRQKEEMISRLNNLPIFRKDPWDYYYDINHNLVTNDRWYVKIEEVAV